MSSHLPWWAYCLMLPLIVCGIVLGGYVINTIVEMKEVHDEDCPLPPEWQCTPRAKWNNPYCKCWDGK